MSGTTVEWFGHVLSILGACNLGTQIKNLYMSVSVNNINSLWIKSGNVYFKALETLKSYGFWGLNNGPYQCWASEPY